MKSRRFWSRRTLVLAVLASSFAGMLFLFTMAWLLSDGFRDYRAWCDQFHEPLEAWHARRGHYPETLSALPELPYQARYQLADCGYERQQHGYSMAVHNGFGVSFYQSSRKEWIHD